MFISKTPDRQTKLPWTGERFLPYLHGVIRSEHFHRYCFLASLFQNKTILDIASGEGYGSWILSMHNNVVLGLDNDINAIQRAKEKYSAGNVNFMSIDDLKIPMSDNYFDVAVCLETIEHVSQKQYLLEEIKRVLKPDGILVISSPNSRSYNTSNKVANKFHISEYDTDEFVADIQLYFNTIQICCQHHISSSLILPKNSSHSPLMIFKEHQDGNIIADTTLSNADYDLILACDTGNIPSFGASMFLDGLVVDGKFHEFSINSVVSSIFFDFGAGLCEHDSISSHKVVTFGKPVTISIDVKSFPYFKTIRLDPCSNICVVKDIHLSVTHLNGDIENIPIENTNSSFVKDGQLIFDHDDPQIYFHIPSKIICLEFSFTFIAVSEGANSFISPHYKNIITQHNRDIGIATANLEGSLQEVEHAKLIIAQQKDELNQCKIDLEAVRARYKDSMQRIEHAERVISQQKNELDQYKIKLEAVRAKYKDSTQETEQAKLVISQQKDELDQCKIDLEAVRAERNLALAETERILNQNNAALSQELVVTRNSIITQLYLELSHKTKEVEMLLLNLKFAHLQLDNSPICDNQRPSVKQEDCT